MDICISMLIGEIDGSIILSIPCLERNSLKVFIIKAELIRSAVMSL